MPTGGWWWSSDSDPGVAAGPEPVAHLPLERLARGAPGKIVHEQDLAKLLEAGGDALVDPRPELLGRSGARLAQDDRGDRGLAPLLVGDPEHRDFAHRGVPGRKLFAVPGIDLHAAADDHVLLPVHEIEEPLGVAVAEIAGEEPSIADRLGGEVGPPVITRHQHRPAAH